MKALKKGLFLTFEGGECAGKTTLIEALFDHFSLQNLSLLKTREPGGTELGIKIRSLLLNPQEKVSARAELLLFAADRAHHVETLLKPSLAKGALILCDRYIDSSFAYQGAFFKYEELKGVMDFATGGLLPHLTFYLDLDPKIGFERAKKRQQTLDRIEERDFAFHESVRRSFLSLAEKGKNRFVIVPANRPKEVIFQEVLKRIEEYVSSF